LFFAEFQSLLPIIGVFDSEGIPNKWILSYYIFLTGLTGSYGFFAVSSRPLSHYVIAPKLTGTKTEAFAQATAG